MKIQVNFFGRTEIFIDDKKIQIQQRKTLALFLYLLFNRNCTRDELSAMFWCDCSEEDSKRNLRNCIYKLKNIVGKDLLTTIGNTYIELNSEVQIYRDIDFFITEGSETELLTLRGFSFLEGFYVKNCEEFEKWVFSIRGIYEKMVLERLITGLKNSIKLGDSSLTEQYAQKILSVDAFQEEACRSLMELYSSRGAYNDAVKTYTNFSAHLKNELEIEPEKETTDLYKRILELKKSKRHKINGCAYSGHTAVITAAISEFGLFNSGKDYHSCIFSGAIGMGKTRVIEEFLEHTGVDCVRIRFDTTSSCVSYYSIEKTIEALGSRCKLELPHPNYNNRLSLDIHFLKAMEQIAEVIRKTGHKELVILENLESVDEVSIGLLFSYLFEKFYGNVFVLGEYCQNFRTDRRMIERLNLMPHNQVLSVPPPDLNETLEILRSFGVKTDSEKIDVPKIHRYTGGNLMFLQDTARNLTAQHENLFAAQGALKALSELFACLSVEEYTSLQLISLFERGVELETLSHITVAEELSLLDTVDSLYRRELLEESKMDNHLVTRIASSMMRDIVRDRISSFKKVQLHRITAEYYEELYKSFPKDYFYLFELHYHYSFTEKPFKRLYYTMRKLQYHLDYCDEFFPSIQSRTQVENEFYLTKNKAYAALDGCRDELLMLEKTLPDDELHELQMLRNFLLGRTLIRDGRRDKGIPYIRELLRMAEQLNRKDMLLKGYLEMIYYGIKREDEPLMRQYVEKAKQITENGAFESETGILLRLEALCDIRVMEYDRAERLLLSSIELFEGLRLQSEGYIHVAAAYNYLALICRFRKRYGEAKEYLQMSIDLCRSKNVKKCLELFYEDYGYILFLEGNYREAKGYFEISSEIYDMFGTYWLRSVGESCMAIISLMDGQEEKALEHFRRAEIFSKKEMTKEELLVLETARGELKKRHVL